MSMPSCFCKPFLGRRALLAAAIGAAALAGAPALAQQAAGSGALDEAVFTAVRRNSGQRLLELIRSNANVNIIGPDGQTPMTMALQEGSLDAFDALMSSSKTNVEFRNGNDESPLMIAAIRGHLDAAQRLLRVGAAVNKTGWSPLHYAASGDSEQQLPIARLLLERQAVVDARSPNGTTPLMMAASYGSDDMAQLLLDAGANAVLTNENGLNAVDFARRAGRDRLAERLAARPRPR